MNEVDRIGPKAGGRDHFPIKNQD